MFESLKRTSKIERLFYYFLFFTFFFSVFLMLPHCRISIINFMGILLHKNLSYEFWNKVLLYTFVTAASFSFFWLISSFFNQYTKSDKFNLKKSIILISFMLFIVSLLVQSVLLYNGIVYGTDDPAYIAIAKAIAENNYKNDFLQMQNPSIQLQYPVGYPILIAIIYKILGMNFYAIKFVNVFLYAVSVVVLFNLLFELIKDIEISVFVSSLFCLNFTISNWQNHTMSDTPCMVFSLFCLALIHSIYFKESTGKYFKAILLGICSFLAYEFRMNGLVCILTLFSIQILICMRKFINFKILQKITIHYIKTNWKIHLIPYIVFIALLILQKIMYPDLPRTDAFFYKDLSLQALFQHFHFFYIMNEFFNSAWNQLFQQFNILSKIAFRSSLLLALYGLLRNWKQLLSFLIFTIGNVIIYCIWGGFGGIRLYFPIIISLAVFCACGAKSLKNDIHSEKAASCINFIGKFLVICFCAMFTISVFPVYTKNYKDTIKANGHSYSSEAQDIWSYISNNISDDKTFIFRSPRELYLYTKHFTAMSDQKADYYLHSFEKPIDTELKNLLSDEDVSVQQIEINGRQYRLEYSNDKFRLFHAVQ
ncbi:MAG: hypothetical protein IKZ86_01270 [Spirochaetaceae bacterium]|nr:hypothetical protein [Spirochaetaceae bacterium]